MRKKERFVLGKRTFRSQKSKHFVLRIIKTTAEIIEILRDYKARSAEKYGIETLGLFGSVARGEQNEKSDIDVFIKLRKTSYYTLMDIKDDLEQVFRQKVDLITLHETMRALFRRKIEQDAIYL